MVARYTTRYAGIAIRFAGFFLLAVIFCFIDFGKLFDNLLAINVYWLLLSLIVVLPLYLIKGARWYFLLKTQGIQYSYRDTLMVWSSSNFIAFITPGRMGEVAKAFYLKNDTDTPVSGTFPTVILDRLFDVYFLLIVALIGFFKFSLLQRFQLFSWISIALIVFSPFVLLNERVVAQLLRLLMKIPVLNRFESRANRMVAHFFTEMGKLLNYRLLFSILLTGLAYLFLFGTSYTLALAADIPIDFFTLSIFTAIANVLSFIPISVSGIGTREAGLIFLFSLVGLSAEKAVLFSSLYFFVFFLVGGLIGYVCFLIKPIQIASLGKSDVRKEAAARNEKMNS